MPRRRGTKRGSEELSIEEKQRINAAHSAAANPLHGIPLGAAGAAFYKDRVEFWREAGVHKKLGASFARFELDDWIG